MPDSRCAPVTLTDEQIDVNLKIIRDCAASLTRAVSAPGLVDRTVAAVIARAKREARGGMANDLALLIDQECPHEPDEHAEGTCEVCDYAFAMAQMVRDYAEAANDDHA